MQTLNADTKRFIEIVAKQTSEFLENETAINTLEIDFQFCDVQRLKLHYLTSIMAVEGPFQVIFAFSFDKELAIEITKRYTADLSITEQDFEEYMDETSADIINIILGNTLVNFQISGKSIDLTPPIAITEARTIYRTKLAKFITAKISTKYGNLQIFCVGPKELFDKKLNYKN